MYYLCRKTGEVGLMFNKSIIKRPSYEEHFKYSIIKQFFDLEKIFIITNKIKKLKK